MKLQLAKSEPQNIECRRVETLAQRRRLRRVSLNLFLKQAKFIHSTFDVGRSMFDVH
jgi:hypothetical protein